LEGRGSRWGGGTVGLVVVTRHLGGNAFSENQIVREQENAVIRKTPRCNYLSYLFLPAR